MKQIKPEYIPPEPVQHVIDMRQLKGSSPLFVYLQTALRDAKLLIERYNTAKSLLMQSAMLPQAEADLLMRYQTTLERRRSNSIGELLELQKRR